MRSETAFFFFFSKLLARHPASGIPSAREVWGVGWCQSVRVPTPTRAKIMETPPPAPPAPQGPRDPRPESRGQPGGPEPPRRAFLVAPVPRASAPGSGLRPLQAPRAGRPPTRPARVRFPPEARPRRQSESTGSFLRARARRVGSAGPAPALPRPQTAARGAARRPGKGPLHSPPRRGAPGSPRGGSARPARPALLFRPQLRAAPPPLLPPRSPPARPRSRPLSGRPGLSRRPDPSLVSKCGGVRRAPGVPETSGWKGSLGDRGSACWPAPPAPAPPPPRTQVCARPAPWSRTRAHAAQGLPALGPELGAGRAPGRSPGAGPSSAVAPSAFVSRVSTNGKGGEWVCPPRGRPAPPRW